MSFSSPKLPDLPMAPPPPPMFGERQPVKKKQAQSSQPTFLGAASTPNVTQLGSKTLLGQ